MKAILVIDLPDDFLANPSNAYRLRIGGDAKVYYVREGEKRGSIIGDIRDIKPMPNKWHEDGSTSFAMGIARGFNKCIDKILGETE